MASSQDYQTVIYGGGWWNPGRSLFPPCSGSLSDFMWLDSSLNDMDEQADQMKQSSYSRSDEYSSDDHHTSSADDQHLHVISSDYAQASPQIHKPQVADFSISDWSENSLLHDSSNMSMFRPVVNDQKNTNNNNNNSGNRGFYNQDQLYTTAKVSHMALENSASSYAYPAIIQTLATSQDPDMSYGFDNSFVPNNWPKLLLSPSPKQQLNAGAKHTNANNSMHFWDSWMGNDEIDTLESHQLLASALIGDQKPCNYGNPSSGISLMSPEVGCKDDIAHKVASDSTLLGTKRKNNTTNDEAYKRPLFETPSSMPTFKVRKEKLGDRITALQQLVSPFGKTDTASVLHEAIEYIKFLHDQVSVLRSSHMQNGTPTNQHQQMQGESTNVRSKGPMQDLKSRGLCLVPISSTFPVAIETTADLWTPTFGGTMTLT